jgi:hypothetical protein
MSFDFWSAVNSAEFQNQAVAENEAAGSGFKRFTESGEYNITIKNAEIRQTKAGDQKLTLRVQADSGESGFWDLLVGHDGGQSKAAKIAQQALALILKYSGEKAASPNALIGLRVKVWVKMEEDTGYGEQARFRPIGAAEGAQAAPASQRPPVAAPAGLKHVHQSAATQYDPSDDDIPF